MNKRIVLGWLLRALLVCWIMLVPLVGEAPPARADAPVVFTVTTEKDCFDGSGNGTCHCGLPWAPPACSLRAALMEADWAVSQGQDALVQVPDGEFILTVHNPAYDDPLKDDLDIGQFPPVAGHWIYIQGIGDEPSIIDADGIGRVLEVGAGYQVEIQRIVFRNGVEQGGADHVTRGGGIYFRGNKLVLNDVTFDNNEAVIHPDAPLLSYGGGLYMPQGQLIMEGCTFMGNRGYEGGALYFGQDSSDTGIVRSTVFDANQSGPSGSAIVARGYLYLVNSMVSGNGFRQMPGYSAADYSNLTLHAGGHIQNTTFSIIPQAYGQSYSVTMRGPNQGMLRNNIFRRDPQALGVSTNCRGLDGGAFFSQGANVADDHSCLQNPYAEDLVISSDDWELKELFPSYWVPYGNSPVVNRRSDSCWAMTYEEGYGFYEARLEHDILYHARNDNSCDAGCVEGLASFGYLPVTFKAGP